MSVRLRMCNVAKSVVVDDNLFFIFRYCETTMDFRVMGPAPWYLNSKCNHNIAYYVTLPYQSYGFNLVHLLVNQIIIPTMTGVDLVGNVCDASATCQQCRVKSPIFCWQGKCADTVTWALYYENSQKYKEKITNKLLKDLFINIVMSMTCISNILPLKHIIWSVWYHFTGKYASMSRHVSPTCRDASVWHVIWTLQLTCQLPTFPTKGVDSSPYFKWLYPRKSSPYPQAIAPHVCMPIMSQ